ncbi:hypothetical protein [Mycoplasmopsis primatum]|uniref:hypothetical protein n=1 Tax=Mycoplasmopsis primatum TaxID=55604 RepID=UPI000495E233|nr:hypothetical protein [Mycoplasmopsis primatum]
MGKSSKKILKLLPLFAPITAITLSSACTNGLVDEKSNVINKISELENLSNNAKNDYKNKIIKTDNINELYGFLKRATNENKQKASAIEQIQKYDLHIFSIKAKQILTEKIKDLAPDNIDAFLNEVNNIKVDKETVLKNINENESHFQKYNFDITPFKSKIADIAETQSLANIKQNVSLEVTRYVSLTKISSMPNLSDNIKNNYKNEILKKQDINKISDLLKQAEKENELKTIAINKY